MSIVYHNIAGTTGGSVGISYELAEQDTGLKWHDGRAIYQKSYSEVWNGATGSQSIPHGITDLDSVINFVCGHAHQSVGPQIPLPKLGVNHLADGVFFYTWDATNLIGLIGTDHANIDLLEFTIEYVKTV
jgi:hypothetical protein